MSIKDLSKHFGKHFGKHLVLLLLTAGRGGLLQAQRDARLPVNQTQAVAPNPQDSSVKQLDQVVVTATKYPVKQNLIGKVLTVITRDDLAKSGGKQLTEVLNTQAGVQVSGAQNTLGTVQDVYVQGADAGKTLILIDGIPAYDPSGTNSSFDLNLINTDMVERVEILKGSQSTLYGSDAVAGVINIIMRKGGSGNPGAGAGKLLNTSVNLAAGSFGTYKVSAGIDGIKGGTAYNLQYTHLHSDGISTAYDSSGKGNFDHDGFSENLVLFHISQKLSESFQLRGNAQWGRYTTDLDAGAYTDDRLYTGNSRNTQAGVGADYTLEAEKILSISALLYSFPSSRQRTSTGLAAASAGHSKVTP